MLQRICSVFDFMSHSTAKVIWRHKLSIFKVLSYKLKKTRLEIATSGASCSKLTTSLVNVSLKFQTLILQIHCYFLLKKCENTLLYFVEKM